MNDCGVVRPLVLVLEGINDCEFLFRLSQRLHAENPQITDLTRLHADGRILLVPTGGGNFDQWAVRFAALGCRNSICTIERSVPKRSGAKRPLSS